ncbi:MAG: DUF4079 domain-containing protein [Leptolyngbyaceae bacterium]|nr:DUF4079 domain-containing protein [Leptolyngbyaceae bacterium]
MMNLPSFIWLWRIAAWSMGLAITTYVLLGITGGVVLYSRRARKPRPKWLRPVHYGLGGVFVTLLLVLLSIGIVGTLGHFGTLGHSVHLPLGLGVVTLGIISAWSATRISAQRPWARSVHLGVNILLCFSLMAVGLSGWVVVQKYLP